jgi:protein involved in polysaccharide export with SLBB domain
MNLFVSFCRSAGMVAIIPALLLLLPGCGTTGNPTPHTGQPSDILVAGPPVAGSADILERNDLVRIIFSGVLNPPPAHEERIKEDGTINLAFIGPIPAAGKTRRELEKDIQDRYVQGQFYSRLTVTVSSESRTFTVMGEVRTPGAFHYQGQVTLLKAIAAAGDFTDFANRRRVEITRANGEKVRVNANQAARDQKLDLPIFPGDIIQVPRRLVF